MVIRGEGETLEGGREVERKIENIFRLFKNVFFKNIITI
jgi:hypothetical protein